VHPPTPNTILLQSSLLLRTTTATQHIIEFIVNVSLLPRDPILVLVPNVTLEVHGWRLPSPPPACRSDAFQVSTSKLPFRPEQINLDPGVPSVHELQSEVLIRAPPCTVSSLPQTVRSSSTCSLDFIFQTSGGDSVMESPVRG
jgi:hypothetical protein